MFFIPICCQFGEGKLSQRQFGPDLKWKAVKSMLLIRLYGVQGSTIPASTPSTTSTTGLLQLFWLTAGLMSITRGF